MIKNEKVKDLENSMLQEKIRNSRFLSWHEEYTYLNLGSIEIRA